MAEIKDEVKYSLFTQYFIEISNVLDALDDEAEELRSVGEEVPQSLVNEIRRHTFIINILTQAGQEMYNKTPKQLMKDGWEFWFKEDTELRIERYQ